MAQASIKRESDADGLTGGKDYPVFGITGACVIIVDDASKFRHVSFAEIDTDWEVSTDAAEPEDDAGDDADAPRKKTKAKTKS